MSSVPTQTNVSAASAGRNHLGFSASMGVGALGVALPPAVGLWLTLNPDLNRDLILPIEHFMIVTLVSLLAAIVALLVARSALQLEQYQILLITLGFMGVAGFFSVHAVATPGVPFSGAAGGYGTYSSYGGYAGSSSVMYEYGGTVVGVSGFMSVFVPAFLFAAGYTPLAIGLRRRIPFPVGVVFVAVTTGLVLYAIAALVQPTMISGLPVSRPPYSYVVTAISVALLCYAAWGQWRIYLRTRFPMHGALVLSFLLLAEAQIAMVVTRFWSYSWWGYHIVMLAAAVLALGALFLELDRRRGLERFLPSEVVERVVAGDMLRLSGQRQIVTVLFADLRGSTAMAERLPPADVVGILNTYVGGFANCVFAERGMLDKFLGDGLMAVFGVLADGSDGAVPAVRAALGMRRDIESVNTNRRARGEATLQFGVGIHTGEVVLGAIGLPKRSDFTAIGDTVNTAARLESLCKQFGVDVVISQQVADRLRDGTIGLLALGTTSIRGKQEPVELYTLA